MRQYFINIIPALLILFMCGSITAQEIEKKGDYYFSSAKSSIDVRDGDRLFVKGTLAEVTVRGWNKAKVELLQEYQLDVFSEEEAREVLDRSRCKIDRDANIITIRNRHGGGWVRQKLTIFAPAQMDMRVKISQGNIILESLSGNIEIKTSAGNIAASDISGPLALKTSGGNIDLSKINGTIDGATSGGNITLSGAAEIANLKTSGGNISVRDAKKRLELYSSGGRIRLMNCDSDIEAKTSGGNIRVDNCRGAVNVMTNGGDIEVSALSNRFTGHTNGGDIEGEDIGGAIAVSTNGGDIELENVRGSVRAKTSAGNIEISLTLTDFKIDHRMNLQTSVGDIYLTIPAGLPATIEASVKNNESRWTRHDIYSDFPLSKTSESDGRILKKSGDINGGGDAIILESGYGEIHIRKQK